MIFNGNFHNQSQVSNPLRKCSRCYHLPISRKYTTGHFSQGEIGQRLGRIIHTFSVTVGKRRKMERADSRSPHFIEHTRSLPHGLVSAGANRTPGPRFNIKITSHQYRKSHCGDKTILRPSYLHNGISYTGKTISLYWIGAKNVCKHHKAGGR